LRGADPGRALLLVISIVLFGLLQLIPGGPAQVAFSPRMSEQARHDMVVTLRLDSRRQCSM